MLSVSFVIFSNGAECRRVFVLVDARHGLRSADLEMMGRLNQAYIPYQVRDVCSIIPVWVIVLVFIATKL